MKQGSAQPSSSAESLRDTGTEAGGGGRAPRARGEGRGAARGKRESPAAGRTRGRKKPGCVPLARGGGRERGQSEKEGAGQRRAERVERPLPAKGEPAGPSEEAESGQPRAGKEVGKEEGKAGGLRGRSRRNFCGRLSRRGRRGKRRIQSVRQAGGSGRWRKAED